jgi:seryl-tRNA synthetase
MVLEFLDCFPLLDLYIILPGMINNFTSRLESFEEQMKSSLIDFEDFITEPAEVYEFCQSSINEILNSHEKIIEEAKSKLQEKTNLLLKSEQEVEHLERTLDDLSLKLSESEEKFDENYTILENLSKKDLSYSLDEAKSLSKNLTLLNKTLCLYLSLSKIRWNREDRSKYSGWILKENSSVPFEIPSHLSEYEVADRFWDLVS